MRKRRDDIADVADMVVDMAADMEVDKVADMAADMFKTMCKKAWNVLKQSAKAVWYEVFPTCVSLKCVENYNISIDFRQYTTI